MPSKFAPLRLSEEPYEGKQKGESERMEPQLVVTMGRLFKEIRIARNDVTSAQPSETRRVLAHAFRATRGD